VNDCIPTFHLAPVPGQTRGLGAVPACLADIDVAERLLLRRQPQSRSGGFPRRGCVVVGTRLCLPRSARWAQCRTGWLRRSHQGTGRCEGRLADEAVAACGSRHFQSRLVVDFSEIPSLSNSTIEALGDRTHRPARTARVSRAMVSALLLRSATRRSGRRTSR
jgi:hypothetical protein